MAVGGDMSPATVRRIAGLAAVVCALSAPTAPAVPLAGAAEAAFSPATGAEPASRGAARTKGGVIVVLLRGERPAAGVPVRIRGPKSVRLAVTVAGRKGRIAVPRRGKYVVRAKTFAAGGDTYAATKRRARVRITARTERARAVFRITRTPTASSPRIPEPERTAPASPPPPGVVGDVMARINAARAAGERCDGTTGPPLAPLGYSAELAGMAERAAADYAAGRDTDLLADLKESGFAGAFLGQTAVVCPKVADPGGVLAAMTSWQRSCSHLFDPGVDRIGIGYSGNSATTNAWVLTFGSSDPG